MVMSTVEVRPHGIRLSGQDQAAIMPPRSADSSKVVAPRSAQVQTESAMAYSVSGILLSQGQQQATSVQIASKSLQAVGKELTTVKRSLTQAVTHGVQNIPNLQDSLVKAQQKMMQVIDAARYDGNKVIDNELKLKLGQADTRRFSIPGLNVARLSDKAEQIRLDFPQGQSVMIQFDGHSDGQRTVKMLDRSLIPLGMRASLALDGAIIFDARDSAYQQMQQKVFVTGEGHRFPAGQANVLNLKAEPDGIAELCIELGSREGMKQTITQVNKHLRQVQNSLEQAKAFHGDLNAQLQSFQSGATQSSITEVNRKLESIYSSSAQFTSAFQALNAQANVRRHTVVALLK